MRDHVKRASSENEEPMKKYSQLKWIIIDVRIAFLFKLLAEWTQKVETIQQMAFI